MSRIEKSRFHQLYIQSYTVKSFSERYLISCGLTCRSNTCPCLSQLTTQELPAGKNIAKRNRPKSQDLEESARVLSCRSCLSCCCCP